MAKGDWIFAVFDVPYFLKDPPGGKRPSLKFIDDAYFSF